MSNITLGIIGSGQLGSLLCQAAKKLNVKTIVISDDEQGPAQHYSNDFIYSKYDDENKIKEFIDKVDIVTFEFENIPVDILKKIELKKKVLPKPGINKIIQNRSLEKTFVNDLGIKTTDWAFIKQAGDVEKNKNLILKYFEDEVKKRVKNDLFRRQEDNIVSKIYEDHSINIKIPFISIPLPTSADNHQFKNAEFYAKKGYGYLLEEKDIREKLPNVNYIGYKPHEYIKEMMPNYDMFVYPSIFEETSCASALEALASGVHVITNN